MQRTRAILASIDDAKEHMAARRQQPAGRLRVNAATPFMLHAVVPLVPTFRKAYPQITLQLDTDETYINLRERRTDVAIRIGRLPDFTLHARPLCTSPLRVLASPDYLARTGKPKSVADLARHTLLGFNQPESLNQWPLRGAHGDAWPIVPGLTASSGETPRHLALQGVGIVCLSDFMTAGDRARRPGTGAGQGDGRGAPAHQRGVLPQHAAGGTHHVFSGFLAGAFGLTVLRAGGLVLSAIHAAAASEAAPRR